MGLHQGTHRPTIPQAPPKQAGGASGLIWMSLQQRSRSLVDGCSRDEIGGPGPFPRSRLSSVEVWMNGSFSFPNGLIDCTFCATQPKLALESLRSEFRPARIERCVGTVPERALSSLGSGRSAWV